MSELSVFVDESGDFGPITEHCPFYIVSLVLHDQSTPIKSQIKSFQEQIHQSGLAKYGSVHTVPLIRREEKYRALDGAIRKKIFDTLFAFARRCDIRHKSIAVDKRWFGEGDALEERIARDLGLFVRDNIEFFQSFDKVVIYYDKGQKEISRTLRL